MNKTNHEDATEDVWQVAAGDDEREYWKDFLKYGVMLIGGGWLGDYRKANEEGTEEYKNCHASKNKTTAQFIRHFHDAKIGERVVLKRGKKAIAVGKIEKEYEFREVFSDVDGFDLRHCRRVKWKKLSKKKWINSLTPARFCRMIEACGKVDSLWNENKEKKFTKWEEIPRNPKTLNREDLLDWLKAKRLPKQIAGKIRHLQKLAELYESDYADEEASEHEIRTVLIVPLIMSLGWDKPEVRVKIEWEHTDVALFNKPYSKQSKPCIIIETKRLWNGLANAKEQAERYADQYPNYKILVVSDGIRYWLFKKQSDGKKFPSNPFAYLNLPTPTRKHPHRQDIKGAISFLSEMIP